MTLRPQFKDMRVCGKCGAPAELFGKPWDHDGQADWWAVPIERRCHESSPGAERREEKRQVGTRTNTYPYYVQVYTHCCIRNGGDDPQGNRSMDEAYGYSCGALKSQDTRRVTVNDMDPRCFNDSLTGEPVADHKTASAGS